MNDSRSPGPGLTPAERRLLDDIDADLTAADPALAGALSRGVIGPPRPDPTRGAVAAVVAVWLVLLAVLVGGLIAAGFTGLSLLMTWQVARTVRRASLN